MKTNLGGLATGIPAIQPPPPSTGTVRKRSIYSTTLNITMTNNDLSSSKPAENSQNNALKNSNTTSAFSRPPTASAPSRESLYGLSTIRTVQSPMHKQQQQAQNSSEESMVASLQAKVASAGREDCKKALYRNNMDLVGALKELQTSQLLRLGIAERNQVEVALKATNWDLEAAASRLLDGV